jgi:transcription initiation factor IIF auxiliary subunit
MSKFFIQDSDGNIIDTAPDKKAAKKKAYNLMLDVFADLANELTAKADDLRTQATQLESDIQDHRVPFKIVKKKEAIRNDYSQDT